MTLLITIFLVLVNIFNTIQTNSPKAEGLTAIEAWVIACIIFVFGALSEYTVLLLKIKLEKCFPKHHQHSRPRFVLNFQTKDIIIKYFLFAFQLFIVRLMQYIQITLKNTHVMSNILN